MKRVTSNNTFEMNMTELALNQVFAEKGWAWYTKAPGDDWLQFGETEPEGILAILYRALWAMAELRERLKLYEDICFGLDGTELLTPELLRKSRAGLKNDPLTLEELREMDGEPVFLGPVGEWALVRLIENEIYFTHKNSICALAKIAFECGVKVYLLKSKSSQRS